VHFVHETTRGSDTREARPLNDPMMGYDLTDELALLRAEPGYRDFGRSSKTLGKGADLRLVLTAARAGVDLGSDIADAPMAIQVLEGGLRVDRAGDGTPFGPGSAIWLAGDEGWAVEILDDAALLISFGRPDTRSQEEHDEPAMPGR
jgi:hypothetical protein